MHAVANLLALALAGMKKYIAQRDNRPRRASGRTCFPGAKCELPRDFAMLPSAVKQSEQHDEALLAVTIWEEKGSSKFCQLLGGCSVTESSTTALPTPKMPCGFTACV